MGLLVLAALLTYEPLPSPNRILMLQEAQARLQRRSAIAARPAKLELRAVQRVLSSEERQKLQRAAAKFVQESPGLVVEFRYDATLGRARSQSEAVCIRLARAHD
jgi:hypothetical protein